ncbi:MAG TPA: carboxypeptidase-like regulatory domain-containing protein [Gemmatimonadaceae bacterium]|nr:carboxypeptidase-like regulatory domain-containing protein [Gemmatimonadaceae bacterium]
MLRARLRRARPLVLLTAALSCDPKETDYFLTAQNTRPIGNLTGLLSVGAAPITGATIALTGPENRSTTTASTGVYTFEDLTLGDYTVTPTAMGFNCPAANATILAFQTTTLNIVCTPQVGSVNGTIRLDLAPVAGAAVTARQGTTTVGSATTGSNGTYTIPNLLPGAYTIGMTPPPNAICPTTQRDVTVQSNLTTTADFDCTSAPGSVTGAVRLNNVGQSGVTVTLTQGATTIGTAATAAGGTYTISNVQPGTYTATITPPAGAFCSTNPQTVTVQSNQAATANFDCINFTVNLSNPAPSYRHIVPNVSSETCTGITTTPAQPGASWTTMWTGTGTVGATQRSGTLNASGMAVDRQPISQIGTYNVNATVNSGAGARSGTGSVTVQAGAGTCPAPPP